MTDKSLTPWKNAIAEAQNRFVAMTDTATWAKESMFAQQIIMKNSYLMQIANKNPASLRNAVSNVAAIGITLNPALAFAYLVPRDGQACLDISYKGMIHLATESGSIQWAQAELVYENDFFEYNGPTVAPKHNFDPFSEDRGAFQGAYCSARTAGGDILSEAMSASQIYEIRDKSEMYKRTKKGPWVDFFGEMAKKTVIKRASKTWPKSIGKHNLENAVELLNNQGEGIEFKREEIVINDTYTIEQFETFNSHLKEGDPLAFYVYGKSLPTKVVIDLAGSGADGHKVKMKELCRALDAKGYDILCAIKEAVDSSDEHGLHELIDGVDDSIINEIPPLLSAQQATEFLELVKLLRVT